MTDGSLLSPGELYLLSSFNCHQLNFVKAVRDTDKTTIVTTTVRCSAVVGYHLKGTSRSMEFVVFHAMADGMNMDIWISGDYHSHPCGWCFWVGEQLWEDRTWIVLLGWQWTYYWNHSTRRRIAQCLSVHGGIQSALGGWLPIGPRAACRQHLARTILNNNWIIIQFKVYRIGKYLRQLLCSPNCSSASPETWWLRIRMHDTSRRSSSSKGSGVEVVERPFNCSELLNADRESFVPEYSA